MPRAPPMCTAGNARAPRGAQCAPAVRMTAGMSAMVVCADSRSLQCTATTSPDASMAADASTRTPPRAVPAGGGVAAPDDDDPAAAAGVGGRLPPVCSATTSASRSSTAASKRGSTTSSAQQPHSHAMAPQQRPQRARDPQRVGDRQRRTRFIAHGRTLHKGCAQSLPEWWLRQTAAAWAQRCVFVWVVDTTCCVHGGGGCPYLRRRILYNAQDSRQTEDSATQQRCNLAR